ncbi:hypothetical protein PV516_18540 [Streptomyces scabiei]|nr:hypothetical protein [Streptomyces scabiei]MDX3165784.1 hypothetical protein [Streptomyces scabiei]
MPSSPHRSGLELADPDGRFFTKNTATADVNNQLASQSSSSAEGVMR